MTRTTVAWHHGLVLADGTPYPLRNRLTQGPEYGDISDRVLGLTEEQSRANCAVHELGHAVLWLAGGLHVVDLGVGVGDGGRAECAPVTRTQEERMAQVIGIVAGERAQDRWLRETGLWTPSLAAMAELSASHDRALVFAADPHPRPCFGDGEADYSELHDLADQALDAHWDQIMTVLPFLIREGRMTGDQLAACTGLPNRKVSR